MTKDILALDSLIRKFKDKFLFGEVKHWAYQYKHSKAKDVAYIPFECKKCPKEIRYSCEHRVPLSLNDLYNHFCQEPVSVWFNSEDDKFDKAGIALRPVFENKQVRWFVVDSDNEESTNVLLQRFIPVLRNYNIDYIYEHGSTYYKCHIWFMVNCHVDTLNDFTRQLFEEADIDFRGKDKPLELEIYPLVKPNALIRIPGGFHLRNKTANPIEYGGITSSDPEFILKTFIKARVLSEEEIKTLTKPLSIKNRTKPSDYRSKEDFSFFSLGLPTHDENFPEPLRKIMSNCQAFNKVIELSKQKFSPQGGYLNTPGNEHHLAGLYLSGICTYLDIREQKKGNSSNECTKWLNDFLLRVRNRDFSSHNWRRLSENSDSPGKLFPRCEVMDRDLNMCKGCPFADKVTSASEFYRGTEITKEKISSINLLPAEVIRKTTFETVLDRMLTYSEYGIEKDILLASPQGSGKCHGINTPILMYDGTIKMVQRIKQGDLLMGPDSKPRKVLSLARGREKMYKVIPNKGEAFTCNESHVLSLKFSGSDYKMKTGDIFNISVKDFILRSKDFQFKSLLWKSSSLSFENTEKSLSLNPYFLGLWLGDGNSNNSSITNEDPEIIDFVTEYSTSMKDKVFVPFYNRRGKKAITMVIHKLELEDSNLSKSHNKSSNIGKYLKDLNLLRNKHIPHTYKVASVENRLQLLAGLIDSDGYQHSNCYEIMQKNKQLADDICFLVRSLGFAASLKPVKKGCWYKEEYREGVYWKIGISGYGLEKVPCLLDRKKIKETSNFKNRLVANFILKGVGVRNFYGFEIDGDHLYLLGDFTVQHNSFAADRMACKLADENRQVLIAVPTARLAIEHRNRIEKMGHKAFILMSHENMFKKDDGIKRFDIDFDCPKKDDIKYLSDLGVSASHYRKQFCGGCKFKESCPYPGQYGKAVEGEHNIVIMQHAHFSCRETLYSLLKKRRFDALIVDEEFIDSLVKRFFISETECEILEKFSLEIPWTERFAKWARGAPVNKEEKAITPNRSELETLRNAFEEKLLPWEIPEYISQYNYHHPYDKNVGFLVFYPLPDIPVRLFLDATPPTNMLKTILNNEALEIFGQNEILDIKTLNKKNEIIQVLNNSTSKTSLEANEWSKFYSLLEYIGDECKAHYKGLQTLVTTYMGEHADRAGEFFRRNYPDIFPQLIISHMKIGTNEFENCQVQFQIAGVHLNAKQLAEEAYKFRRIANYWHRMSGRPEIPNPYPYNVKETSELDMFPQDLVRVELLPEPGFYAYPYPLYKSFSPQDPFERQVYELALAKRQQAMRMRFNDGQQKTVIIFDNSFRNSLIITKSIQLESLI